MASKTTTYLLRDVDVTFWSRVKAKAALEQISVRALLVKLLTKWLGVLVLAVLTSACGDSLMGPSLRTPICRQTDATTSTATFNCQQTRRSPVVPVGCTIIGNVITCHKDPQ